MPEVIHRPEDLRVEVHRGPYLESMHQFSACVVQRDGAILYRWGDIECPRPIRSLAKPFIARELVRSGAAKAFDFGDVEIALAAGSHDGEPRHVGVIRQMLAKLALDEQALLCGPAMEGKTVVGPAAANNCSGKHVATLALCRHFGYPIERYTQPKHPVQLYLFSAIMPDFGAAFDATALAVDGCGMPVFGASLRQIASAYAHLTQARDAASARVCAAISAQPGYVGGWQNNLDTQIIEWSGGKIIGKIGAEGLHADVFLGCGVALAIKVHDGNSRALAPILAQLIPLCDNRTLIAPVYLKRLAHQVLINGAGSTVGNVLLAQPLTSQREESIS